MSVAEGSKSHTHTECFVVAVTVDGSRAIYKIVSSIFPTDCRQFLSTVADKPPAALSSSSVPAHCFCAFDFGP
ncbi:hypothetical protein OUZ56_028017 [Daphnia magna]|uniref:Uncharacterized protein n=1 Tax=Daphnia magna TaxID=35525 RepID=A0ABR0B2T5_9CRUS|nr:hypothetical protein OUZ56_028017 [Daphnia magna]